MDPKAERIGDEEECTIHIPTSKVGLVIGVSGAVSTRIKVESGVQQYKVERDGSDARVRVYGNRTCVDKATDMTNQALRTEAADDTLEMHVPNKEVPSLIREERNEYQTHHPRIRSTCEGGPGRIGT